MSAAVIDETSGPGFDEAVVRSVRQFAQRELNALEIDRAGKIPPLVLDRLAGLGVFGVTLPQQHGGLGAGLPLATQVVAALAEVDRSVAVTVGLHLGLGTRALVRYGSPKLQAELLPALASGEWIAAFGTTEPGAGSDLSKLKTTATRPADEVVLDGEKAFVTNGGLAHLLTVTASTHGTAGLDRGMVMVALPMLASGVVRLPEEHKLGLRGSSTTGCLLEGVKVPSHWMLGDPSTGKAQLDHTLAWGRTLMSAGCVGAATSALAKAREHVAARRQFGRPLEDQPVVQGQLASSIVLLGAMKALVETAAAQESDRDLNRWSVSAKVFCSEQGWSIVDTALQLHGAMGYIEDTGLAMMLRDMRVTRIFEGANDVLLTHAGAIELQNPAGVNDLPPLALQIAQTVSRRGQRLRDELGVRAFRRPELLHWLGEAVVWRDAVVAGCRAMASPAAQRTLCREACSARRAADRRMHPADDQAQILARSM
ncbi:MAG: Butyryl-CoA dehydrogenase [Myxococcaceae bacterium]|nr:Butyryl-CoA dehydrogenase [Myxococcaceae bacterium]